jgi:hypothetical protein
LLYQLITFIYYFKSSTLDLTAHTSLSPIWRGFAPSFVNYKLEAQPTEPVSLT